jgi:antibiotic biosynthesis monooxygenase (ABM) superfamily enzyme
MLLAGLLGMVLAASGLLALVASVAVVALICAVYPVDTNIVMAWFGVPLALLMSLRWFYKNKHYVKSLVRNI